MPKLAANLSTLFTEVPFLERFARARAAGFNAVECQFPYQADAAEIKARLDGEGLEMVLFNTPAGAAGERGLAALPGREADFALALEQTLAYAEVLGTTRLHVMAGLQPKGVAREACLDVFRRNLERAAKAAPGRTWLIEPINTQDVPDYLISRPDEAAALVRQLELSSLRLQFDVYHCQLVAGDITGHLARHLGIIAHVQISSVPGRHEPDQGEIDYGFVLSELDRLGYSGWVGCEYTPCGRTEDGLGWAARHGVRPPDTMLATGGITV